MDQTAGPGHGDQLGRRDRLVAIARLEEISEELGMLSSWLSRSGEIEDKAGILVEDARKDLDTACWALSKPAHTRPEGWPAGRHASRP